MPVKGGAKLSAAHLRQQQQAPQVRRRSSIGVHWVAGIRTDIPDRPSRTVAHEYGARCLPMRPFMRPAIYESLADKVRRLLSETGSDPKQR